MIGARCGRDARNGARSAGLIDVPRRDEMQRTCDVSQRAGTRGDRKREVEALVSARHGEGYLRERHARTELKRVNRELKQLRGQLTALEERRSVLLAELGEQKP